MSSSGLGLQSLEFASDFRHQATFGALRGEVEGVLQRAGARPSVADDDVAPQPQQERTAYLPVIGALGQWLLRGFFQELARRADYREVGGSLLLGLRGNAIVCHGGSGPRPLQNAIHLAAQCAERGLEAEIAREFGRLQGQASA